VTLPGDTLMLNGISYWKVNRGKAKEVASNLLLGQTTDNAIPAPKEGQELLPKEFDVKPCWWVSNPPNGSS